MPKPSSPKKKCVGTPDGLMIWRWEDIESLLRALANLNKDSSISVTALTENSSPVLKPPLKSDWIRDRPVQSCSVHVLRFKAELSKGEYDWEEQPHSTTISQYDLDFLSDPDLKQELKRYDAQIGELNKVISNEVAWNNLYVYRVKHKVVYIVDRQAVSQLRMIDCLLLQKQRIFHAKASVIIAFLRLAGNQSVKLADQLARVTGLDNMQRLRSSLVIAQVPPVAIDLLMGGVRPSDNDLFPEPGLLDLPPLPSTGVLGRIDERKDLRRKLGLKKRQSAAARIGICGMAGIGKTTLVAQVIRDNLEALKDIYHGGLFWVKVGGNKSAHDIRSALLAAVSHGHAPASITEQDVATSFRGLFTHRQCLFVLDDVRRSDQLSFLDDSENKYCSVIVISDSKALASSRLQARHSVVNIPPLSFSDSRVIIRRCCGNAAPDDATAKKILDRCNGNPLAVHIMSNLALSIGLDNAQNLLDNADINQAQALVDSYVGPDEAYDEQGLANLFLVFSVSVENLNITSGDKSRYLSLAALPEKANVPIGALASIWRCTSASAKATATSLRDLSLAFYENYELSLHDMLHTYLVCRAKNPHLSNGGKSLIEYHDAILSAYADKCNLDGTGHHQQGESTPWWEVVPDGYFPSYLGWHMAGAGHLDNLRQLLVDVRWLSFLRWNDPNFASLTQCLGIALTPAGERSSPREKALTFQLLFLRNLILHNDTDASDAELLTLVYLDRVQEAITAAYRAIDFSRRINRLAVIDAALKSLGKSVQTFNDRLGDLALDLCKVIKSSNIAHLPESVWETYVAMLASHDMKTEARELVREAPNIESQTFRTVALARGLLDSADDKIVKRKAAKDAILDLFDTIKNNITNEASIELAMYALRMLCNRLDDSDLSELYSTADLKVSEYSSLSIECLQGIIEVSARVCQKQEACESVRILLENLPGRIEELNKPSLTFKVILHSISKDLAKKFLKIYIQEISVLSAKPYYALYLSEAISMQLDADKCCSSLRRMLYRQTVFKEPHWSSIYILEGCETILLESGHLDEAIKLVESINGSGIRCLLLHNTLLRMLKEGHRPDQHECVVICGMLMKELNQLDIGRGGFNTYEPLLALSGALTKDTATAMHSLDASRRFRTMDSASQPYKEQYWILEGLATGLARMGDVEGSHAIIQKCEYPHMRLAGKASIMSAAVHALVNGDKMDDALNLIESNMMQGGVSSIEGMSWHDICTKICDNSASHNMEIRLWLDIFPALAEVCHAVGKNDLAKSIVFNATSYIHEPKVLTSTKVHIARAAASIGLQEISREVLDSISLNQAFAEVPIDVAHALVALGDRDSLLSLIDDMCKSNIWSDVDVWQKESMKGFFLASFLGDSSGAKVAFSIAMEHADSGPQAEKRRWCVLRHMLKAGELDQFLEALAFGSPWDMLYDICHSPVLCIFENSSYTAVGEDGWLHRLIRMAAEFNPAITYDTLRGPGGARYRTM